MPIFHQSRRQNRHFMAINKDIDSRADFHPLGERNSSECSVLKFSVKEIVRQRMLM
jgi:hypothetical protein